MMEHELEVFRVKEVESLTRSEYRGGKVLTGKG
jgi:hypothetical protein